MDLKEVEILGSQVETHWYYVTKAQALIACLKNLNFSGLLDVGAGSGFFSKHLLKQTSLPQSICVDPFYESEKDEIVSGKPLLFRKSIDEFSGNLVMMMDVLEHIENDSAFLKDYVAKTQPGTWFLISVPAFNFLFSPHDRFLEHHRRYSSRQLKRCLKSAGLEIHFCHFFFATLFPVVATIRLIKNIFSKFSKVTPKSELKMLPSWFNHFLIALHQPELKFFKMNTVAGLTLFCLARKPL